MLLGNFQDGALSCSATGDNALMFGPSNSVGDLYRQSSNGAVTFAGAVYGPYQISSSSGSCSYSTWSSELDAIAQSQGINLANYPRRVYVFPQNACASAGYGSVGGSPSRAWIFHCGVTDLYAHELGHNLGLRHAWTPGDEYGDTSDIMGLSGLALRQFAAPNKVTTGWIPSSRVVNVSGSGQYTLEATAAANPAYSQALTLPKPDTKDAYFISFRQPIGYDSGLSGSYQNRVSIHRGSASMGMPTYLLGNLGAGQSFNDSTNGYRFTVSCIGATTAQVSVEMSTPACARSTPSLAISPITQTAAPGKSISYQVTVTNNNNAGCGTSTFAFNTQVPSGWSSSVSPFTVSLDAGASTSSVWTVTSPSSGVVEQTNPLYSTAYDTSATTSAATAQANYIVTAPDATPPTVAITSPADGSTVRGGKVAVSATAADDRGVAKVEFWVDGNLMATDTSAPYSFNWNLRKVTVGPHTLAVRAFDAAGNVGSASSTINYAGAR